MKIYIKPERLIKWNFHSNEETLISIPKDSMAIGFGKDDFGNFYVRFRYFDFKLDREVSDTYEISEEDYHAENYESYW